MVKSLVLIDKQFFINELNFLVILILRTWCIFPFIIYNKIFIKNIMFFVKKLVGKKLLLDLILSKLFSQKHFLLLHNLFVVISILKN